MHLLCTQQALGLWEALGQGPTCYLLGFGNLGSRLLSQSSPECLLWWALQWFTTTHTHPHLHTLDQRSLPSCPKWGWLSVLSRSCLGKGRVLSEHQRATGHCGASEAKPACPISDLSTSTFPGVICVATFPSGQSCCSPLLAELIPKALILLLISLCFPRQAGCSRHCSQLFTCASF